LLTIGMKSRLLVTTVSLVTLALTYQTSTNPLNNSKGDHKMKKVITFLLSGVLIVGLLRKRC